MAAGAKGENGDSGKPGVTPLDSCDMVRPGGNWEDIFQHPFMILPDQNRVTLHFLQRHLGSDERKMAASYFASCLGCMA